MIIEYAKRCEKSMLISTIIVLILGLILAIEPSASIKMLSAIIALLFMCIGGFQIFSYIRLSHEEKMLSLSLILGIVLLVLGILLFVNLESLVNFVTILIGLTVGIKSLFKLQFAINLRDISDKWKYNLTISLAGIFLSLLILLNPFESAVAFLRIIGLILVIGSIIELIETNIVLKTLNSPKED